MEEIGLTHEVGGEFEFALEGVVAGGIYCGAHGGEGNVETDGGSLNEGVDGGCCPF